MISGVAGDAPESMRKRVAARIVVIDEDGCALLFCGHDPHHPERGRFWFTPGGGLDEGESIEDAARREFHEETGLSIDELGPVRFERTTVFEFESVQYEQREHFFCVNMAHFEPANTHWNDVERRSMLEHRWWSRQELAATNETVFPEALPEMLDQVLDPPTR